MRGPDESPEPRVPADHPLRAIRVLTDDVLRSMSHSVRPQSGARLAGSGRRRYSGAVVLARTDLTLDFKVVAGNFDGRDERKLLAKAISGWKGGQRAAHFGAEPVPVRGHRGPEADRKRLSVRLRLGRHSTGSSS